MKNYKGFLIDLDGTTYFGTKRIPSAEEFIKELVKRDTPFLFLTNNATKSPEEVAENLRCNFDLPVKSRHVYTSVLALLDYLKEEYTTKPSIYLVGEESLEKTLVDNGYEIEMTPKADVVIQALKRDCDYNLLSGAVQAILNGADFIVTNTDRLIPTEDGFKPSSGAITAFIEYSTQVTPIVMGKPNAPITEGAIRELGLAKEDILLIGDNYQTDIQAGFNAGVDTLMVLTGVTKKEDLPALTKMPTYVMNDLSEWDFYES